MEQASLPAASNCLDEVPQLLLAQCSTEIRRAGELVIVPVQRPDTSIPSIFRESGMARSDQAAIVGRTSMVPVSGIANCTRWNPRTRITHGTRWPPSKVVPLPSRSGPAEPAMMLNGNHGPLSLAKITNVFFARPSSSIVASKTPRLRHRHARWC